GNRIRGVVGARGGLDRTRSGEVKPAHGAIKSLCHWRRQLVAETQAESECAADLPVVLQIRRKDLRLFGVIGGDRQAAAGGQSIQETGHSLSYWRGAGSVERPARPIGAERQQARRIAEVGRISPIDTIARAKAQSVRSGNPGDVLGEI